MVTTCLNRLQNWARSFRAQRTTVAHGSSFTLHRGDVLLGQIDVRAELCDFPWYGGAFTAAPAFAPFEPLFREELRLLDAEEMEAWGEVWQQIDTPPLVLTPAGAGTPVSNLQIHIRDGVAWWRP